MIQLQVCRIQKFNMKCEIERMEINYTFYFFAFLRKMIKKLLTFCYWQDCEIYFDFCWCPSGSVQSETDRQSDLYRRTGLIQYRGEKSGTVLLYSRCGHQYELSGRHDLQQSVSDTVLCGRPEVRRKASDSGTLHYG